MQIAIPTASTLRIDDRAGLSPFVREAWCNFLRVELTRLQVHPEGLGAWGISLAADLLPDQDVEMFVRAVSPAASAPFRIVLVRDGIGEAGPIDRRWLGAYSSQPDDWVPTVSASLATGDRPSASQGGEEGHQPSATLPVIWLHVDRIEDAAKNDLVCSIWELAGFVLRHELGHHVSRISTAELDGYDSSTSNAETCRPETAAQLFAWLTSDVDGRMLMERMDLYQNNAGQSAYTVYRHFLNFALGTFAGKANRSAHPSTVRPGWMMAWQLVQKPKHVAFTLPSRINIGAARLRSIRDQIGQLGAQLGQTSVWPMLTTLGHEFHVLTVGLHAARVGIPMPPKPYTEVCLNMADMETLLARSGTVLAIDKSWLCKSGNFKDGPVLIIRNKDKEISSWIIPTVGEAKKVLI